MKVTIQNGANHGLSRREAEAVVGLLPSSLSSIAKSLVLYGTRAREVSVSFHPKEQVVGWHWPLESGSTPTKFDAVEELLVALSVIAERGDLPEQISTSTRSRHLETLHALAMKCEKALCEA
jgi:hypothetical protein